MKVEVPGDARIDEIIKGYFATVAIESRYSSSGALLTRNCFKAAIAYANEQLEQTGTGSKQLSLMDEDTLFNKYQELKNTFGSWFDAFKAGYEMASVSSPLPPTKRPFLTEDDIAIEATNEYGLEESRHKAFYRGARWARDTYEAAFVADVSNVEPKWQPAPGDKCVFWMSGWDFTTPAEFVEKVGNEYRYTTFGYEDKDFAYHCAALESLDEIGKPPSYFENRGRWSGE